MPTLFWPFIDGGEDDVDLGAVLHAGDAIGVERGVHHVALRAVEPPLLEERVGDALDHAAVHLAARGERVDHAAAVVDGHHLLDLDHAGLDVHGHLRELAAGVSPKPSATSKFARRSPCDAQALLADAGRTPPRSVAFLPPGPVKRPSVASRLFGVRAPLDRQQRLRAASRARSAASRAAGPTDGAVVLPPLPGPAG